MRGGNGSAKIEISTFCIKLKVILVNWPCSEISLCNTFTEMEKCPQIVINVAIVLLPCFIYKYLFLLQICGFMICPLPDV